MILQAGKPLLTRGGSPFGVVRGLSHFLPASLRLVKMQQFPNRLFEKFQWFEREYEGNSVFKINFFGGIWKRCIFVYLPTASKCQWAFIRLICFSPPIWIGFLQIWRKKPSHVLSWAIACFWNLFIASRILGTVVQGCKCQVAGIFVPPAFFRLRSILYPKSNPCAESSDDTPPSRNGTRIFGSSAFCERDREYLWAVLLMGKFKGRSQQNGTSAQKEMPAKHTWVLLSTVICSPPLPLIIFWSLMGWVGPL